MEAIIPIIKMGQSKLKNLIDTGLPYIYEVDNLTFNADERVLQLHLDGFFTDVSRDELDRKGFVRSTKGWIMTRDYAIRIAGRVDKEVLAKETE